MNGATRVEPVPAVRFRVRVRELASADAWAVGALGIFFAALVALTWQTWGNLGQDTGYDLVAGANVAHGQFPYIDYIYYYGPLAPFLLGAFDVIGGSGVAPAVTLGLVLSVALLAAVYVLGRRIAGVTGGFLAAALTAPVLVAPTNFSFVLAHTYSVPLGILLALCFVLAAGRYADTGGTHWLATAGIVAGLVALTRPEFEVAVVAAAGAWLVLRARAGSAWRREIPVFVLPAVAVPAAVYGAFLTAVSPHRLLFENLYPVDQLREAGNKLVRLHAPLTAGSFASLGGKLLLYAAGVLALLLAARALARSPRLAPWLLAVGTLLVTAVAVARPETLRFYLGYVWAWTPAGAIVAVVVYLVRFRRRSGAWSATAQIVLLGAIALAITAVQQYGSFLVASTKAQPAVYLVPLAALFLVRLHLEELGRAFWVRRLGALWLAFVALSVSALLVKDARHESLHVSGPGGSIAATPADGAVYTSAVGWIEGTTRPGAAILVAPQLTWLYSVTDRVDPLPQISLLPGALPNAAAERSAIATLERRDVRLVVVDRRLFTEYGHTSFGGSFDRVLASWIHHRFHHEATLRAAGSTRSLDVWRRFS
jgi:hypothetical protein